MDNKKTGRLIAHRRKQMNLSQKQLAEKLNVTDKAVSKWETGNGAPDISMLTLLARTLNVSVVELLDGECSEKTDVDSQTEKVIIEALQKARKTRIKTIFSVLLALLIVFSFINFIAYAYWGNRHKILYNVDTVFVHQDSVNENIYDIYYNCSVKNWWFDFNKHSYTLEAFLDGEPGSWHFESELTPITSSNLKETSFVLHVEFDKSSVWVGNCPTLEKIILMSKFSALDDNEEYDSRATLYMNDFKDVNIVFV